MQNGGITLILDACCGSMKIYKGSEKELIEQDELITIDIRRGDFSYQTKAQMCPVSVIVKPTVLADMRFLPFRVGVFDEIFCDPPHLDCSLTAFMSKAYGSWDQHEIIKVMKAANKEFARVLKYRGRLTLKILTKDQDRYKDLLKNFYFHIPIQTIRAHGCIEDPETPNGALWLLGFKKDVVPIVEVTPQEIICLATKETKPMQKEGLQ